MTMKAGTSMVSFTKNDYYKMVREMYQPQPPTESNSIIERLKMAAEKQKVPRFSAGTAL